MNLLGVFLTLIVIGALVWLTQIAPFLDSTWKAFIKWTAIVITVLWLISLVTPLPGFLNLRFGR